MGNSANNAMTAFGVLAALFGVYTVQTIVLNFEQTIVSIDTSLPLLTRVFVDGRDYFWLLPLAVPAIAWGVRMRDPADTVRGAVALGLGLAIMIGLPLICLLSTYFD